MNIIQQCFPIERNRRFITFDGIKESTGKDTIHFDKLEAMARTADPAQLRARRQAANVIAFLKRRIEARSKDLAPFKNIKKFTMLPWAFTEEQGEVTPALKIRRIFIYQRYKKLIDAMYEGLVLKYDPRFSG